AHLRRLHPIWTLWIRRLDHVGVDRVRRDGVRLNGVCLNGIRLNGARLNGVRFDGIGLNGVRLDFGGSDLLFFHITPITISIWVHDRLPIEERTIPRTSQQPHRSAPEVPQAWFASQQHAKCSYRPRPFGSWPARNTCRLVGKRRLELLFLFLGKVAG